MYDQEDITWIEDMSGEKKIGELTVTQFMQNLVEHGPRKGESMLVVGSGSNSISWRKSGAQTLDIDPTSRADFIGDANKLADVLQGKKFDIIVTEALTQGDTGVNMKAFLIQAYKALNVGGKIIIFSAHIGLMNHAKQFKILDFQETQQLLISSGFENIQAYHEKMTAGLSAARSVGDKMIFKTGTVSGATLHIGEKL